MAPAAPPPERPEDMKLPLLILKQLEAAGPIKINWAPLQEELGVEKLNTLQKRWATFKKKENFPVAGSAADADAGEGSSKGKKRSAPATPASEKTPKKAKTATSVPKGKSTPAHTPKAKSTPTKGKGRGKNAVTPEPTSGAETEPKGDDIADEAEGASVEAVVEDTDIEGHVKGENRGDEASEGEVTDAEI